MERLPGCFVPSNIAPGFASNRLETIRPLRRDGADPGGPVVTVLESAGEGPLGYLAYQNIRGSKRAEKELVSIVSVDALRASPGRMVEMWNGSAVSKLW